MAIAVNGDRDNGRLHSLSCHSRDGSERFAPQVTNRPSILPDRDDKCQNAAADKGEPQISRGVWSMGGADPGDLLQVFEELDDREAEADRRDRRCQKRRSS